MALNFPASPSNGQEYVAPNGVTYIYDAAAGLWYVKTSDAIGTSDINDSAITTAKIADDAVTGDKLANDITISTTGDLTANSLTLPTAPVVGYQQGVWIPASDQGTLNYVFANTRWTRVGDMVTVWTLVDTFSSSASSTINIISLPYNCPFGQAAGSCFYKNCKVGYDVVYVANSGTHNGGVLQFYQTSSASWDALKYSNITGAGFTVYLTATYFTDDTTWTPINGATVS
ncbi:hypothetical protein [Synechococcus phage S-H34]|uniref:Uncharacterized protein n=1 Tax=Synechococcus phage S-H34 TaxID=2718942 RepID=A0A6G8R6D1_9CAUD|nr:tail collar fiber protein [Synechococcus phage S-H34]QIN96935.1 hypothetical protein [Synechococcus phage S-H34]